MQLAASVYASIYSGYQLHSGYTHHLFVQNWNSLKSYSGNTHHLFKKNWHLLKTLLNLIYSGCQLHSGNTHHLFVKRWNFVKTNIQFNLFSQHTLFICSKLTFSRNIIKFNCETQRFTDQKLSSPIFACRPSVRPASVTSAFMPIYIDFEHWCQYL